MAIKRYVATKDTTITNAYEPNMITRGTGSNMGRADTLEVFSIYGQADSGSAELSRVILEFPVTDITTDRSASTIPLSGNVSFYLRMLNAPHAQTLARNLQMTVAALVSRSWAEGNGLDMEEYSDLT